MTHTVKTQKRQPTFIDLFAGCGGLSLGLMQAGWEGLFAIEKDPLAFGTLEQNLIGRGRRLQYCWPDWLPVQSFEIGDFIRSYGQKVESLRGSVDLLAGGPPCQGFSLAGRRDPNDPRNRLFRQYLKVVRLVKPKFLILENVRGISVGFGAKQPGSVSADAKQPHSELIRRSLERLGYRVSAGLMKASSYGVPQLRPRYIMFGIRRDMIPRLSNPDMFLRLSLGRSAFLGAKGLPTDRSVTCWEAISDLETVGKQMKECTDSPGFRQVAYSGPTTDYQRLLRVGMDAQEEPNSMRLANHRDSIRERWRQVHESCRHGVQLSADDKARLGMKKQSFVPLAAEQPSHTLTTLPDDLLHYSEPRILTVRECARLQSFPDWYRFQGKYTTGGDRRTHEVPRYSQVGNAVPPMLAEAIGLIAREMWEETESRVLPEGEAIDANQ